MRIVAVIQARMGSRRLPGKSLAQVVDRPLVAWTLAGVQAIPGIDAVVVATSTEPADDSLADALRSLGATIHRGPVHDVLTRCRDAVAPLRPDVVVRQTADNPFPDPSVARAQIDALLSQQLDYVGIAGWPLGIAAEVCSAAALETAAREAVAPAEREHVMPFIHRQPERFAVGAAGPASPRPAGSNGWRFTVDTPADLAFARAVASRLGHPPPVRLPELDALLLAEPGLATLNAGVEQQSWRVVDGRAPSAT